MKKLAVMGILVAPLFAGGKQGTWDFGGKVSLVDIGGGNYRPKVTIYANYNLLEYLAWRNGGSVLLYGTSDSSDSSQVFDFSLSSELLAYPLAHEQKIDPYFGPGAKYTYDHTGSSSVDGTFVVGVDFLFIKGKTFGIEGTYTFSDLPNSLKGSWEMGLTGSWEWEF